MKVLLNLHVFWHIRVFVFPYCFFYKCSTFLLMEILRAVVLSAPVISGLTIEYQNKANDFRVWLFVFGVESVQRSNINDNCCTLFPPYIESNADWYRFYNHNIHINIRKQFLNCMMSKVLNVNEIFRYVKQAI